MPHGDSQDVMKAYKIFSIYKGNMFYIWLLSQDNFSMLIGNEQTNTGKFLRFSEDLSNNEDSYTLVRKVIYLLKDNYFISVDKTSGLILKPNVLKKYIHIVRKYYDYGKDKELNNAIEAFLKYYSLDDAEFMKVIMSDINIRIEKVKEMIKNISSIY